MMDLDYKLARHRGYVNRRLRHIEERMDNEMTTVDDLTVELQQLRTDLGNKFGEIDAEFTKIEQEKSEGKEPDLTPLKDLVGEVDASIKNFTPGPQVAQPPATGAGDAGLPDAGVNAGASAPDAGQQSGTAAPGDGGAVA